MSYRTGDFPVTADEAVVGRVTIIQNGLLIVFNCTCEYKTRDILRLAAVCHGKYVPLGVMVPEAGLLRTKKSFTKNALQSAGYEDTGLFHLIKPDDVFPEPGSDEPAPPVTPAEAPDVTPDVLTGEEDVLPEQASRPAVYNDFPDPETYDFDYSEDESESVADAPPPDPQPPAEQAGTASESVDGWVPLPNPGILFEDESIQEACEGIKNALITEGDGYLLLAVPVLPSEPFPLMPVFCFGSSGQAGGQECIIFKVKNGNLIL